MSLGNAQLKGGKRKSVLGWIDLIWTATFVIGVWALGPSDHDDMKTRPHAHSQALNLNPGIAAFYSWWAYPEV